MGPRVKYGTSNVVLSHREIPSLEPVAFAVEFLRYLLDTQPEFRSLQRSYPVKLRAVVLRKIDSWCPSDFLVIYGAYGRWGECGPSANTAPRSTICYLNLVKRWRGSNRLF